MKNLYHYLRRKYNITNTNTYIQHLKIQIKQLGYLKTVENDLKIVQLIQITIKRQCLQDVDFCMLQKHLLLYFTFDVRFVLRPNSLKTAVYLKETEAEFRLGIPRVYVCFVWSILLFNVVFFYSVPLLHCLSFVWSLSISLSNNWVV